MKIAILLLLSWAIIVAGNVVAFQSGKKTPYGTGYDVGHTIVPRVSFSPFVINLVVVLSTVPVFMNIQAVWSFVIIYTVVMLIRALTINLTLLPEDEQCPHREFTLDTLIQGHCSDKVFSGHQALVATAGIVAVQYGIISPTLAIIYNCVVGLMLLATRSHYSIDIFLGALIPYLIANQKVL
jgi:hypothetical protein